MVRPPPPRYRPLKRLTLALGAFSLLAAAAQSLTFVATVELFSADAEWEHHAFFVDVVGASSMQTGLLLLGQWVLMLSFFRRAEDNNAARGRRGTVSPWFLVLGFLVPFYNLVHRYVVARQVFWGAGDRCAMTEETSLPPSAKLWGAWGLTMGVLGVVVRVMALTRLPNAMVVNAGLNALDACVETALLVLMAGALDARQAHQHQAGIPGASVAHLMGHVPDRPQR